MKMRFIGLGLLAAGCVPPEEGIDNSRIRGEISVAPFSQEEADDALNEDFTTPEETPAVFYGYALVEGGVLGWGVDDQNELTGAADRDWYSWKSKDDYSATIDLEFPGQDTAIIRMGVYNLDEIVDNAPTLVTESDVTGGSDTLTFDMVGGVNYGIRLAGVEGAGLASYRMIMHHPHPDEAGIIVGAYPAKDDGTAPTVTERGYPLAGSSAGAFEQQGDYSFIASYEMFLVRSVETTQPESGPSETITVEGASEVYVFAGNFPTLQPRLAAGTWYSDDVVTVSLKGPAKVDPETDWEYFEAELVEVDAIAPLVVGVEHTEAEPNDGPFDENTYTLDVSDPSIFDQVGELSGPGFVNYLYGNMDILSADAGWVHDIDVFALQVPQPALMAFSFDWEGTAEDTDFDLFLFDGTGEYIDVAASLDKPETSAGFSVLQPEETYFLAVLGYLGPEGTAVPYSVEIELIEE